MNRRGFLGGLAAALIAPFVPAFAQAKRWVNYRFYTRAMVLNEDWMARVEGDSYIALVHPDVERDLRDMVAREQWKGAYRAWRLAGRPPMTPQQIFTGAGNL